MAPHARWNTRISTLTEEQRALAVAHYAWARGVSRACAQRYPQVDTSDLVGVGIEALVRATTSYLPAKGRFKSYARRVIRAQILRYAAIVITGRYHGWCAGHARYSFVALNSDYTVGPVEGSQAPDELTARLPGRSHLAAREQLTHLTRDLCHVDQMILLGTYGYDYSLRELGAWLGLSYERVRQRRDAALEHVRRLSKESTT